MRLVAVGCSIALLLAASAFAAPMRKPLKNEKDGAWCGTCVNFMGQAIDELLNIIANVGVLGSCSELCGMLSNSLEAEVCDVLCDIVGIEGFIDLVQDADPDPIWICEELTVCPISDNAKANITSVTVSPASGAQGTTFNINIRYQITSTIATGEMSLLIAPPDAMPFGDGALIIEATPGMYAGSFQLQAQPSEQEPFDPGQYLVQVALCEGSCGSIHSHSYTLSVFNASFAITQ